MSEYAERPLQPPPGVALIDKICIAADQRERRQAQAPDRMEQMMVAMAQMMEMQTRTLQALATLALKDNEPKPKFKSRPR
jgi:hypothetical protein